MTFPIGVCLWHVENLIEIRLRDDTLNTSQPFDLGGKQEQRCRTLEDILAATAAAVVLNDLSVQH